MDSKMCTKCKQVKPLDQYFNDKRVKKDGKQAQCKICIMAKNQANRELNKDKRSEQEQWRRANDPEWQEKVAIRAKRYYDKMKEENGERCQTYKNRREQGLEDLRTRHPYYFMWAGARLRAKDNNIPFDIDLEDIKPAKYCPILEIEMVQNEEKADFNSMSLDKIIPELGYVKGNICVISRLANTMKSDASFEELKTFAKNILTYINNKDIVQTIENDNL